MSDGNRQTPNLADFDVILINTSAGKDSQAMLDYVVELAEEAGVRDRLIAVHADLGRVEWKGTRELAERQVAHYGLRFEVVSRAQGDLLDQVEERAAKLKAEGKDSPAWPSSTARYCTSDHKRGQVATLMTRLAKEHREAGGGQVRILNAMGLRAQESPARAKRPALELDKRATNGRREVWNWNPILDWTVEEVWDRIKASGVEHHRAYDLGMPRLSCVFCIFAPKAALIRAGYENRELLDEYVAVEERIGHQFRGKPGSKSGLSLREVKDAIEAGEEPGEIRTWGNQ